MGLGVVGSSVGLGIGGRVGGAGTFGDWVVAGSSHKSAAVVAQCRSH